MSETKKISFIDMAKLTHGESLTRDPDMTAIKLFEAQGKDTIFVKSLDAYYPVTFNKDIIFRLLILLEGKRTEDEKALLYSFAYELGLEDELLEAIKNFNNGDISKVLGV